MSNEKLVKAAPLPKKGVSRYPKGIRKRDARGNKNVGERGKHGKMMFEVKCVNGQTIKTSPRSRERIHGKKRRTSSMLVPPKCKGSE